MAMWNIHQLNHLINLLAAHIDIQADKQQILSALFHDHEQPPAIELHGSPQQQLRQLIMTLHAHGNIQPNEPALVTLMHTTLGDNLPDKLIKPLWSNPVNAPYGYEGATPADPFVYVAYSEEISEFGKFIEDQLKAAGFNVWQDKLALKSGTVDWLQVISDAIALADHVIGIVSKDADSASLLQDAVAIARLEDKPITSIMFNGVRHINGKGVVYQIDLPQIPQEQWRDHIVNTIRDQAQDKPPPDAQRGYLILTREDENPRIIPISDRGAVIGRRSQCDVQLFDRNASRFHARVGRLPDGRYVVVDLGSTNGTWVGSTKMPEGQPFEWKPGQTLRIESYQIELRLMDEMPDLTLAPRNPYKGLRPFRANDHSDFFGRDALLDDMIDQLKETSFLAVVGPSGSGKTSTITAGLLPILKMGGLPQSHNWAYTERIVPGTKPVDALIRELSNVFPYDTETNISTILIRPSGNGLAEVVERMEAERLVVFIDQFEELFTLTTNPLERQQFINLITTAARSDKVTVIIALQADYYDEPMNDSRLGKLIEQHSKSVLPLGIAELVDVITGPAAMPDVQITVEKALIFDLLYDVIGQNGSLPLLQFILSRLFEQRDGLTITQSAYHNMGRLTGALNDYAEQTYQQLPSDAHRAMVYPLFTRLIVPGLSAKDSVLARIKLVVLDFSDPVQNRTTRQAMGAFVDAGLLVLNTTSVSIAHRVLLSSWERLINWIESSPEDLQLQRKLSADAEKWFEAGSPHDYSHFYDLATFHSLDQWSQRHVMTRMEQAFFEANVLNLHAQGYDPESESDAANILPTTSAFSTPPLTYKTTDQPAESRFTATRLAMVMIIIAVVAGLVTIYATSRSAIASLNAIQANRAVEAARAELEDASTALVQQESFAESVRLGGLARQFFEDDPELAYALAIESVQRDLAAPFAQHVLAEIAYSPGPAYIFSDHKDAVRTVSFNPDGSLIASGSDDGTVNLWDAVTGELINSVNGHLDRTSEITFGADGSLFISSGADGMLKIWDVIDIRVVDTIRASQWDITTSSISPDMQVIASGVWENNTITLWDAETHESIRVFDAHDSPITVLLFAPDNRTIISADSQGVVLIWDYTTGEIQHKITHHSELIYDMAIDQTGQRLAIASADGTVSLWDVAVGEFVRTYNENRGEIQSVAFSHDSTRLAIGNEDGTISLVDVITGAVILRLYGHTAAVTALTFSPDDTGVLSGSLDHRIILWDITQDESLDTSIEMPNDVTSTVFSQDGETLYAASSDGTVIVWGIGPAITGVQYREHNSPIAEISLNSDGTKFVTGGWDEQLLIWDAQSHEILQQVATQRQGVTTVKFGPNNKWLAFGTATGDVITIPTDATDEISVYNNHVGDITDLAFSPDGHWLYTSALDNTIKKWDLERGELAGSFRGHEHNPISLDVSPDGNFLVVGYEDGLIRLHEATDGSVVQDYIGHTSRVNQVSFAESGKLIVSGSADGTIKLWDIIADNPVRTLTGHDGPVLAVAISPDEQLIASGSNDRSLRLWRFDTLPELIEWTQHNRAVRELTCDERVRFNAEPYCN